MCRTFSESTIWLQEGIIYATTPISTMERYRRGAHVSPLALVVGERAHVSLSTLRYMGEPPTEGFCEFCRAGRIAIA